MRNAMTLTAKDLSQFVEFRRVIEVQAARRAAERATPADLADLEQLCLRMNDRDIDFEQSVRLDFQFHLRIVEIAGNELMQSALGIIQEFIMTAMAKSTPNPRDHDNSRKVHMELVRALRSGDPDVAERAARAHMDLSEGSLKERDGRKSPSAD
jgi:DNA-binding FadR family transcriptional regulator